jgi:hypothetical protein
VARIPLCVDFDIFNEDASMDIGVAMVADAVLIYISRYCLALLPYPRFQ